MSLRVMLCLAGALALYSQSANTIDPAQRQQILHNPNGLKTLAQMSGGHFSLDVDPSSGRGSYDLSSAARASSLVLNGTIKSLTTHLSADGDNIDTLYTVHPEQILKGSDPNDITVQVPGGKVTFDNGNTAEINSLLTQHLIVGHSYIFFLNKTDDGKAYTPEGSFQVIIDTSSQDKLTPLAKYDSHWRSPVVAELAKYSVATPNDLVLRIQYLLSEL
jgi:hypothetical protein